MSNTRSPHEIDILVGKRIRELRQHKGVTQELLAKALGLTFQQVQKYEKGTNRVSVSRLCHIAEALECPVTAFLPAEHNPGDWVVEKLRRSEDKLRETRTQLKAIAEAA